MVIIEMLIGLSSGILIGAIFVAILTVLAIFPRIFTLFPSKRYARHVSIILFIAVLVGTYISFTNQTFRLGWFIPTIIGLIHGIFNGMVTAALLEMINVFPKMVKTLHIKQYFIAFLYALLFGKMIGAILQATLFFD